MSLINPPSSIFCIAAASCFVSERRAMSNPDRVLAGTCDTALSYTPVRMCSGASSGEASSGEALPSLVDESDVADVMTFL